MLFCLQHQNARLILGRSGIEGYGIFARQPIFKGEMVVEYTGERVRPVVADVRETLYENMGLGTYFWRYGIRQDVAFAALPSDEVWCARENDLLQTCGRCPVMLCGAPLCA